MAAKSTKSVRKRRSRRMRNLPPLEARQYRALASFRSAIRRFLAFSEAATRATGVTAQQYQAMLAIKAHPDEIISVGGLANELLLKHNGAVQQVDRLVAADLVRRVPADYDRRVVLLRLTSKGEDKITQLAATHFRELGRRHAELKTIARLASEMGRPK